MGACAAAVGDRLLVVPVGVLRFRVDRERLAGDGRLRARDVVHLLHGQDRELAVQRGGAHVLGVVGGAADPLLELGHREVGDRPVVGVVLAVDDQRLQHRLRVRRVGQVGQVGRGAGGGRGGPLHRHAHAGHGALARGDVGIGLGDVGDVGVVAEPGVVAHHQHAVAAQVQVFLERIGAGIGGGFVGHLRFLGIQARQAAMADHQRRIAVERLQRGRRPGRRRRGGIVVTAAGGQGHAADQGEQQTGNTGP